MPKSHPPYPPDFRRQMVQLVRTGRSPEELAQEFEPTAQAIRNWVQQADRDEGLRHDGLTTDEREELNRLPRENRQLKQEREILKKAEAWFAGNRSDPGRAYEFIKANQAIHCVSVQCRILEVSRSGFYAWLKRAPSARKQQDEVLLERIKQIYDRSRGTYGAPRVLAEIKETGILTAQKRIARLMAGAGLVGISRRRSVRTTIRGRKTATIPDLVKCDFRAESPNRLWIADITYVPTWSGFLYLSVVLDVFSRRVVGWSMATNLRAELVLNALEMAISQRRPEGVIHHSDQGAQYTSLAFKAGQLQ